MKRRRADQPPDAPPPILARHGQGLLIMWQGSRVREQPQPLDGRHEAPLQPEPPEGPDRRRRHAASASTSAPAASRPARSPRPARRRGRRPAWRAVGVRSRASFASAPSSRRALAHLEARRQEINDLNVFPVADGDTGDNMASRCAPSSPSSTGSADGRRTLDEIGRDEIVELGRARRAARRARQQRRDPLPADPRRRRGARQPPGRARRPGARRRGDGARRRPRVRLGPRARPRARSSP